MVNGYVKKLSDKIVKELDVSIIVLTDELTYINTFRNDAYVLAGSIRRYIN